MARATRYSDYTRRSWADVPISAEIGGRLDNLRNLKTSDATGDSADAAFESGSEGMASQLAELDARELGQIERAMGG